jgi:hypothetical protein
MRGVGLDGVMWHCRYAMRLAGPAMDSIVPGSVVVLRPQAGSGLTAGDDLGMRFHHQL